MEYLFDLGFSLEEINTIKNSYDSSVIERIEFFPRLICTNYEYLKNSLLLVYLHKFVLRILCDGQRQQKVSIRLQTENDNVIAYIFLFSKAVR